MIMLPHIATRLYGTPLLMHPAKAEVIAWALQEKMGPGFEAEDPNSPEASRFLGTRARADRPRGLAPATGGVGIVSLTGSLVNRGAWIGAYSGVQSYEGIAAQLADLEQDKEIKAVVLDLDTPGGEAGGVFGLAERVRALRKSKRVVAVVNDMAASAGYAIASAADEIVVSSTSMLGSIGVVVLHLDRSEELSKKGIKATLIHAGAHKVDVNPFGPLSAEGAAELTGRVMAFYDRFVEAVEAGRGARMSANMARGTEARVFMGAEAIKAGLADRVGTIDQVVAELSRNPSRPSGAAKSGGLRMEKEFTQADLDNAKAEARAEGVTAGKAEGHAAGLSEGIAKGSADTVVRLDGIFSLEESKGRRAQALALFKAGLTAGTAKSVLAATPKIAGSSLAERIRAEHGPSINGPSASPTAPDAPKAGWAKAAAEANTLFGGQGVTSNEIARPTE